MAIKKVIQLLKKNSSQTGLFINKKNVFKVVRVRPLCLV